MHKPAPLPGFRDRYAIVSDVRGPTHGTRTAQENQDQFDELLPVLATGLPPADGKPRHAIHLENGEPWLRKALEELQALRYELDANEPAGSATRHAGRRRGADARKGIRPHAIAFVIALLAALFAAWLAYKFGWVQ